ncbi:MAG: flagellar motor switch protein FliN [Nocardioidaceae bacterium]|nr:flagellar motor switch protein FliN [Nocardioidaceae bacterium]
MTTTDMPPTGSWLQGLGEKVGKIAEAVARLLPSSEPLVAGAPGTPADIDVSGWAAAAVATLSSGAGASVAVLVRADLADALAAAPSGALDLAAAVQPALDAAAQALGVTAGAGRTVHGPQLAVMVSAATVAVPLQAGATTAAIVVLTVSPGATPAAGPATPAVGPAPPAAGSANVRSNGMRGVELLHGVAMEVTVELGRTRLSVRELLALCPGDVLELDRAAGSPADLLVNGRLIARGEVVVVDEDFALRVTEIVAQPRAS